MLDDLEPIIVTLNKMNRKDLSLQILDEFKKHAHSFQQYDNLTKCYFKSKDYMSALELGEKALVLAPTSQYAHITRENLVNVYNHANFPEKALRYIKQCMAVVPADYDLMMQMSFAHYLLNEKDKAESILRSVLEDETIPEELRQKINFNLGTYHMLRDEFSLGLGLFLKYGSIMEIWKPADMTEPHLKHLKAWDGKPVPGATVVVGMQAGLGDEIINFRFLKHIKDMGMTPVYFNPMKSRKDLMGLFEYNGYQVVDDPRKVPSGYFAECMHLPVLMGLEYPDLWYGPYLNAKTEYVEKWIEKLGNLGRRKIAIRFQGNPEYDQDLHRSVPLKEIYESVKHIDADFYSIQRDTGMEELADFPGIIDLSAELNSWDDTLGIIANMDQVISTCTSVLHASAASGAETLALIPISAYYTWCHTTEKSPWYPENVTIFRQVKARTWKEPLQQLKNYIK